MALTYTDSNDLGHRCPDFNLPTVDGRLAQLRDFAQNPVLVVMFLCGHCPYVQAIEGRILDLAKEYQGKGVGFVAICSNDPSENPEDTPGALLERWTAKNYSFPYLIDESQIVAKSFGAVCTPDLFVFNQKRELSYHGRLDDSWRNPAKVTRRDLALAIDTLLDGKTPSPEQNPAMGCSIKWK